MIIDEQIGLDITTNEYIYSKEHGCLKNDTKSTFFIRLTETESTDFGIACFLWLLFFGWLMLIPFAYKLALVDRIGCLSGGATAANTANHQHQRH